MSRRSQRPALLDVVELVRLPAALTVPGDSLAGAAAAGWPLRRRTWLLPAASACLYWAGMALNDYADRDLDAVERPERPIPSGRVHPALALRLAGGLTALGVGLASAAGGRRTTATALPLAGAMWTYDLVAKHSVLGPAAMAGARALDVLMGATGRSRGGALPALTVAAHTLGVTALSRGEVHGTRPRVAASVAANTMTIAALTAARGAGPVRTHPRGRLLPCLLGAAYAATVGRAQLRAARSPDAATVRTATGAGVRGTIPLQATLTAGSGSVRTAVVLVALGPCARAAGRVVSPT